MITFSVNSAVASFDGDPSTPLLWVLRDHLQLTGTRFGCGIGQCGACTVHLNGEARRSCSVPVSAAAGTEITTIEGLAPSESSLHPVQQAWLDADVSQCGYCQGGLIMATVDLLKKHPQPSDRQINESLTNICRCGTYPRIHQAVKRAVELTSEDE